MDQIPGQMDVFECIEVSLEELAEKGQDVASKYDFNTRDNPVLEEEEDECPQ